MESCGLVTITTADVKKSNKKSRPVYIKWLGGEPNRKQAVTCLKEYSKLTAAYTKKAAEKKMKVVAEVPVVEVMPSPETIAATIQINTQPAVGEVKETATITSAMKLESDRVYHTLTDIKNISWNTNTIVRALEKRISDMEGKMIKE
jgi:rRNA processing protein Krr1/Pno1